MTIYEQVIQVSTPYLGPASERFVSRQINTHLSKNPQELAASDLPKLAEWVKLAMELLTKDEQMINDYSQQIAAIQGKAS